LNDDDRLEPLVGGYLDGQLTPDETQELIARLRADRGAVAAFADMAHADVLMEQYFHRADIDAAADSLLAYLQVPNRGAVPSQPLTPAHERGMRAGAYPRETGRTDRRPNHLDWFAAAVVLMAFAAGIFSRNWRAQGLTGPAADSQIAAAKPSESAGRGSVVATVEQSKQVDAGATRQPGAGEQLFSGQTISIESGLLQVHVLAGADLIIKGPASLEFISPLRAVLHRGTLTARVTDTAHGFRIDTPTANVIDLKTEFGVSAAEGGDTNVVVFAGEVEMHVASGDRKSKAVAGALSDATDRRLLRTGDGLRVASKVNVSRLVAINTEEYPTSFSAADVPDRAEPAISAVSDNLREGDTSKCYRIVPHGLAEDMPAYVDRTHEWNGVDASGIPPFFGRSRLHHALQRR
jgi:anti-sigma factor RsiW